MFRSIAEAPEFTDQLAQIGDIKRLDERLNVLTWALWIDAEDFPLVTEGNRLRVAELSGFEGDPTLTVWFEIDQTDLVILRWIEVTEEESDA